MLLEEYENLAKSHNTEAVFRLLTQQNLVTGWEIHKQAITASQIRRNDTSNHHLGKVTNFQSNQCRTDTQLRLNKLNDSPIFSSPAAGGGPIFLVDID